MAKIDYVDEDGFKRRVFLPDGSEDAGVGEGIPISLDVSVLYPDCSPSFVRELTNSLWAVGLVEPSDFLVSTAPDRIRAALLSTIRRDTMDIITLAKENIR